MGVNTKEMSIALGLPEDKIKDILGVNAFVTCFEEACMAYVEAIQRNGESVLGRKSAFEALCNYAKTFEEALKAYLLAPRNTGDKDVLLELCTELWSTFLEAEKLLHFARTVPGHEAIVIKKIAVFF